MKKLLAAIAVAAFGLVATPLAVADTPTSDQQNRIRIDVGPLQPRLVTGDQPDMLTVSGTLTNVGDRKVDKIEVRLERGGRLNGENGLRDAMARPAPTNEVATSFFPQVESLAPGQSRPFNINIVLHGTEGESLKVNDPGVYPLMVNANGVLDGGFKAKVGQAMTVLPVLSVPGGGQTPKPAAPAKLTVLWPLTDRPRILSERRIEDVTTNLLPTSVVLTDDGLATSLAAGGRLDGLLTAAETAPAALSSSLCFAIDPDLLTTVWAMTGSYQVLDANGHPQPGRSQPVAKAWLDRLKSAVQNKCVFALPFADADLTALSSVNASTLVSSAVADSGGELLKKVLDVSAVQQHLVWPVNGQLDAKTATDLTAGKVTDVLVSSATVPGNDAVRVGPANGPRALRTDDLVSTALASASAPTQSTLAALMTRITDGSPLIVAPPHQWNASAADATALLNGLQTLVSGQYLTPTPLTALIPATAPTKVVSPDYTPQASPVATDIERHALTASDLLDSMQQDPSRPTTPQDFMAPIFNDLVRSGSSAWRGDDAAAARALDHAKGLLTAVEDGITVLQPRSPITLASQDSPLLITVSTVLPVQVQVLVRLSNTTGLNPGEMRPQLVAAGLPRNLQLAAKVVRTGKFTVVASLTTRSGLTTLGQPGQLELTSTAYGPITLIITGIAGAALFGLSGLRIYRRVSTARKRRTEPVDLAPVPSEAAPAPVHLKQPAAVPAGSDERPDES